MMIYIYNYRTNTTYDKNSAPYYILYMYIYMKYMWDKIQPVPL